MSRIELSEREHGMLRKVLESYLRELRGEIVHTDARDVRDGLKEEENVLKQILGRLPGAGEDAR